MPTFRRAAIWFILLFALVWPSTRVGAQAETTAVDLLAIDLWPDYDRPSVLVLLTGTLPAATPLPARLTIPLPAGAELNAVARITSANVMTDDVQFSVTDDAVSFVTPDARFRVEYYVPYTAVGDQREFTFTWQADFAVNELDMAVQQPAAAIQIETQPAAASIIQGSADGLTYHQLPATAVPARQPYSINLNYTMPEPVLSVARLPAIPAATAPVGIGAPAATAGDSWPIWLAALGGILITIAVVWQVAANRQQRARPFKAAPVRRQPQTARFCHACGQPLQRADKFCRNCGTAVKLPR